VFTWVEGANVDVEEVAPEAAEDLAGLIRALRSLGATDAPPGLRRGTLREHDEWVRGGVAKFHSGHDGEGLLAAWEETLEAPSWDGQPIWCHCDLDLRNVVFRDGRPSGVLDWGWAGAGDPASDAAVAWKMLPAGAREEFWEALGAVGAEITRARGWTLLQCAGALSYYTRENNPALFYEAERWLSEILGSAPRRS
jgi:aminoglycoside phosphotransferase (APT) family kinase protein